MPFVVPQMPLTVNIWNNIAVALAPSVVTTGNLSPGKRVGITNVPIGSNAQIAAAGASGLFMELLLPKLTDIRGLQNNGPESIVECPAGSGRFYLCVWVDDIGKGFANEHRMAILCQCNYQMVAASDISGTFGAVPVWPSPLP